MSRARRLPPPLAVVIGAGRLGSALARGLKAAGWRVEAWTRGTGARRGLVRAATGPHPASLAAAELVILSVPDRAVAEVAAAVAPRLTRKQVAIHCAGSLGLEPLAPLRARGVAVGSLHPLVAAQPGRTPLRGRAAALDGDRRALALLRRVASQLGLEPLRIEPDARVRYHAAASLAANGLVSLVDLAVELLAGAGRGMSRDEALAALLPLVDSAVSGLHRSGLPAALTGPVARGDAEVVAKHLAALRGSSAEAVYRALAAHAVGVARAQGRADPAGLSRIAKALQSR